MSRLNLFLQQLLCTKSSAQELKTKTILAVFMSYVLAANPLYLLSQAGTIDNTFNPTDLGFGYGDGANSGVNITAVQADGKVLIGGGFTEYNGTVANRIARLNSDGSLDMSFNPGTGPNSSVLVMAIQADGKIIIAGFFSNYNGISRNRIARLNTDGSLDLTFNPGTGPNNFINSISIQPDGSVVIGGNFTTFNGTARSSIARLISDGNLDLSFDPGSGANSSVSSIAIQSDGRILIGGTFTIYNGVSIARVARLNSDGSLDAGFNPGAGASGEVQTIALQSDSRIIIGGNFTSYNGTSRGRIARLNDDGSLDVSFNPGGGAGGTVSESVLQSDGKVVIGGSFTTFNGSSRKGTARLNLDGSLTKQIQGIRSQNI